MVTLKKFQDRDAIITNLSNEGPLIVFINFLLKKLLPVHPKTATRKKRRNRTN